LAQSTETLALNWNQIAGLAAGWNLKLNLTIERINFDHRSQYCIV
jgi:hypothetical protein